MEYLVNWRHNSCSKTPFFFKQECIAKRPSLTVKIHRRPWFWRSFCTQATFVKLWWKTWNILSNDVTVPAQLWIFKREYISVKRPNLTIKKHIKSTCSKTTISVGDLDFEGQFARRRRWLNTSGRRGISCQITSQFLLKDDIFSSKNASQTGQV